MSNNNGKHVYSSGELLDFGEKLQRTPKAYRRRLRRKGHSTARQQRKAIKYANRFFGVAGPSPRAKIVTSTGTNA